MDSWHATFLGLRHLPREVTAFEIEAFYQFSAEECRVIEERRRPELKLALALQWLFADERASPRGGADRPADVVEASGRALQRRRSGLGLAACDVSPRSDLDRTSAAGL